MTPRPGRVRDPVHGYVVFTAIERALLDHPVAQRLRHVSQSAAAQFVFPEMRVSRLAHSLGAMHLASRFFAASLANAGGDVRARLGSGFDAVVARHAQLGLGGTDDRLLQEAGLQTGRDLQPDQRVNVMLVEQGLRLASLVHDLGHLPFSHDFETALEQHLKSHRPPGGTVLLAQGPGGDKIHERVGYALASTVLAAVFNERLEGTPVAKAAEVSLSIARDILNAPAFPELDAGDEALTLSWLHGLIAGELDVDRADYVLRDARHYGLTAAGFDVDRLVDNLAPAMEAGRIVTAVLPQGVSAAESLSVARFRMYAWAIYHHKVQQIAAGLHRSLEDLLEHGGPAVASFLEDITAIAEGRADPELVARFAGYDDIWCTMLLRDRLRRGVDAAVEPWLALFVERRPGPRSLWKRPSDFPAEDRAAWNRRLPGHADLERRAAFDRIRSELAAEGILIAELGFRPWNARADRESALQVITPAGLRPLTQLSPLTRALAGAWESELHLMAFAASGQAAINPTTVLERLEPALHPEQEPSP